MALPIGRVTTELVDALNLPGEDRLAWYRSAVRGCFWIAIVAFVVIWILERLAGWALG